MTPDARLRARRHLDSRLSSLEAGESLAVPPRGWIRAIRDALGMSRKQLAARLGLRPQTLATMEKGEASGAITLKTLRRAAEALDCRVVYAFVPNTSLEDAVRRRAREIALRDLGRVAHTMKLEAQATGDADLDARVEDYIRTVLRDRDLWNDP